VSNIENIAKIYKNTITTKLYPNWERQLADVCAAIAIEDEDEHQAENGDAAEDKCVVSEL